MKRITSSVLFLLILLLSRAQAQPPSLQDRFLDNFVGDWGAERKMSRGRVQQTSVHCEWVLNHQFIEFHYGSADAKPEYEAFVFIGFDDSAKKYVCHWVDVFGARDSAMGYGKLDQKLLAVEFKFGKDGELTNKFTFDPQSKTWTSLIRQIEKGEWTTFAEEKWSKQ
jgi:hypothetical protein